MSILMLGRGVGRQAREVGRQGGSLDLPFSLYFVLGRASRPRPTQNKHTNKQTNRQTDKALQPNPLPHRTQGPKYAARHPLALIRLGLNENDMKHYMIGMKT